MTTEVYLALGSNVGDSKAHIKKAIELLGQHIEGIRQARIYHSKAVGYTEQDDFLNTAIRGVTDLSPQELMAETQWTEQKVGRTETFHWGPREIDIDIIFYGDMVLKSPKLNIPHLSFRDRAFVLKPLNDLNPDFVDPQTGLTVALILKAIHPKDRNDVQPLT